MRIFIDAGHNDNGADTGAQGNGLREQDINYSISQKLGALLSKNFDIMYSRPNKTDNLGTTISQSINKRIYMANQWQANLYISVHCNANPDHSANGTETLIFAKGGQAESLASHVQSNLVSMLGSTDRGVKTQNVGVLRETSMPAILVETAFITNAKDSQILVNRQDDIAQAIAEGIFEFLGMEEKTMIATAEQAIQKLVEKSIITSPEYWTSAVQVVNNLESLLIKIANVI